MSGGEVLRLAETTPLTHTFTRIGYIQKQLNVTLTQKGAKNRKL